MDSTRLDLNLLVTFEALLSERNVTRAAARLHLSQPAVSAQLSRLRVVFADPLLIPAHRGMTATAKALALFEQLRPALDALRGTLAGQQNFDPAEAELTAAIACSDYTQGVLLLPLVVALRKTAPNIRIAIRALNPETLEAQMARGEVDVAFVTPELAPSHLRTQPLFDERYVLIGRRGHPRLRKTVTLEDFLALEHVVVSPSGGGFVTPVDDSLAARGLKRRVVLSVASFLFVPQIVARSDFAALVPERLVRHSSEALKIVAPPLPVQGFAMEMAWHERSHGHPGQRWLRDTIAGMAAHAGPVTRRRS